jgi:hypothetical protein
VKLKKINDSYREMLLGNQTPTSFNSSHFYKLLLVYYYIDNDLLTDVDLAVIVELDKEDVALVELFKEKYNSKLEQYMGKSLIIKDGYFVKSPNQHPHEINNSLKRKKILKTHKKKIK